MKQTSLLTFAVFCILSFTASAQITKGSTSVGGSLNFNTQDDESMVNNTAQKLKSVGWNLSPEIGKAVGDNKIAGIFFSIGGGSSEGPTGFPYNKITASTIGGGFFYRLYVPLSSRFYLFGASSLGANLNNEERKMDEKLYAKNKSTAIGLSAMPGISFRATKKLYLETGLTSLFSLTYYRTQADFFEPTTGAVTQSTKSNRFNVNANSNAFSNIAIGVRWILPSKS